MTRIILLLGVTAVLGSFPYLTGNRLAAVGKPGQLISVALLTLIGLALGGILIMAVVVGPTDLPIATIPDAVARCVDAAGSLFAHPLNHWPHILVSVLVLWVLARLVVGAVQTVRATGQGSRGGDGDRRPPPGPDSPWPDVRIVESADPLACTAGLLHPYIVVSTGLLRLLDRDGQEVVVAHERAHVRGWHPFLLFVGRVVSRAFGFLPPVRRAVDDLLLGLELAADASAARAVGDPLAVARVLTTLADRTYQNLHAEGQLGADGSDVAARVHRLIDNPKRNSGKRKAASGAVVLAVVLLGTQVAAFAANTPDRSGARSAGELHAVCHLPHGDVGAVSSG